MFKKPIMLTHFSKYKRNKFNDLLIPIQKYKLCNYLPARYHVSHYHKLNLNFKYSISIHDH